MLHEKDHPGIQFLKYVFCGGCAFAADVVTFFIVAWLFFPALTEDDVFVRIFGLQVAPVDEHLRVVNFRICTGIAFLVSNMTAYVLNVRFVFKAGKHSRWKELGLFYLVSGISIVIGMEAGAMMIGVFGLSTSFSYMAKAVSATLINYAARKFFIFHG
ncbi:GtrA family protein [Pontiella sulfatireligans]|nr:GtrA family protein [Pontiella sulfatireligans]